MINFLKKQFLKITVYIIILALINSLWFFSKWDIFILFIFNSFITSIFTFVMSKTWLEDYKLEMNKELEKYKTKLSGYTLVTKLQYDLEFKIYTELAFKIADTLESLSKFILSDKLKEKNFKEKNEKSIIELMNMVIKYKPFYPEPIYEIAENIAKEMAEIHGKKSNSKNTTNEIYKKYIEYSRLVKIRIENMKIIED
jgi:hypothetical protein